MDKKFSSEHFTAFLAHETVHYYMQDGWNDETFRDLSYNEEELDLIDKEYQVLDKIDQELKASADTDKFMEYAGEYLKVMDERFDKIDKEKLIAEISEELVEGSANYITIKTNNIVGYDYVILYFDNTKAVIFNEIVPTIKAYKVDQSMIGERLVYDSGVLLANPLDNITDINWQEKLNESKDKNLYFYDLIKEVYENK